jgi:hypothetical protein
VKSVRGGGACKACERSVLVVYIAYSVSDYKTYIELMSQTITPPVSLSVEARLRRCVVPGTSPELYGVIEAFQVFKKLKYTEALCLWKLFRKQLDVEDIVIQGPTGSLCVREEGLEKLLMSMKECEANSE